MQWRAARAYASTTSSIIAFVIGSGRTVESAPITREGAQGGSPVSVAALFPACQSCWNSFIPCRCEASASCS